MSLDIILHDPEQGHVLDLNITHNLTTMAKACGLYQPLWRPEEIGASDAHHLIPDLEKGILHALRDVEYLETLEPDNGWGTYDNLLTAAVELLKAAHKHPNATITISR